MVRVNCGQPAVFEHVLESLDFVILVEVHNYVARAPWMRQAAALGRGPHRLGEWLDLLLIGRPLRVLSVVTR